MSVAMDNEQRIQNKWLMSKLAQEPAGDSSHLHVASWYQVTLAAIGDAVLTTDPDGLVTYLNPVAETLTGWSAAEAIGKRLEDVFRIVNEETRKPVEQPVRKVIDTGLVRGLAKHTLLIAKDGSELPIDDSAAPVWGRGGELVGDVMIFRDVTERRQTEHVIASARAYAESIVNTVREPLLILQTDLHVRSANRSFYDTFRVEPSETEGRFIYDLGNGQWDIPALRTLLEEIIPENSHFDDFEVEHDFQAIGPKTMLLNARRFPPEGKWELILLAVQDITDRKRLEVERDGLLGEAKEARVRAEEDAAKLAEADLHKNEFLAMLAHELRNPLAAITSAVRMARRPGLEDHLPHAHEVIERQAGNLARLIDDLLDVSRIIQGKVELKREVVDVPALVGRATEAVRPLIEQRRHELTVQFTGGPMHVDADPTRLEQVVGNLVTNAAKYTEKGGTITVSARKLGGEVVIEVKDTGVGISKEMLPKVFDLFTQVDRSLARSEGGLGIGLSLVRRLVEMHGGSVEAASRVGHGSKFTVRLPLVEAAAEKTEPTRAAEVSGAGRRVLLVDDNADTARLTGRLLKSLGFEVRLCHDGRTAIEEAREFRPEVILLDIGLPGLNGFEVARTLRGEACCGDSLIIGISGYGDQQTRERAREAGFDHYLVKPVDIEAVTELASRPRNP